MPNDTQTTIATLARRSLLAGCCIALMSLGGCRPEEQGRPLDFEKGSYLGKKDEALSEQQRKELRERAEQMR
jgi:hypothetical protein